MAIRDKLNEKEYALLIRRAKYSNETLAQSARKIGIREDYARKIVSRLRGKIENILGINRRASKEQN